MKEAAERAERARVFVAKHLSLLEDGGNFECLNRSDIIRNLALDHNTGMSLQYRNLLIIESMHPDAAARMAARTLEDSKSSISRIKAVRFRIAQPTKKPRARLLAPALAAYAVLYKHTRTCTATRRPTVHRECGPQHVFTRALLLPCPRVTRHPRDISDD